MRIGDVPHKCEVCGYRCRFEDCNIDDPFGDGSPGCPVPDCGGEMKMIMEGM